VPTGVPWSGMVQSGWYAKRFDDLGGSSGFAWKLDRSAFIGECVDHPDAKQLITYADGFKQTFQGLNTTRQTNHLTLFTPQYGVDTGTGNLGSEVVVQLSRPLLIVPTPRAVTGTITAIYTDTGSTIIPFDSVVLSAKGTAEITMTAHVAVGEVISISQEIKPYKLNCTKPMAVDWGKTYASVGGAFYFLRDGIIRPYPEDPGATERLPRTAIVLDNDYVYFIVVDGRSWMSRGMSMQELGTFVSTTLATSATLTTTYGISQDGGGSSTMVVNGEVQNYTLCNNADCRHYTFLPLLALPSSTVTATQVSAAPAPAPTVSLDGVDAVTAERYVANGIMMVVVEPMTATTTFTPTQVVKTSIVADLRLGPGTNYDVLAANIPKNTSLVILPHPMNGVLAKGSNWWKVDYNGVQGWVRESELVAAAEGWR
jgi:Phosphodiester glycosidase